MNSFDPDTLWHWLYFRLKCYEVSGAEFQRLFEEIMKKHEYGFIKVKPYGIIGDKKSDGVYSLGKTVFQVYSPEELTLSELKQKINEDLLGAVKHWSNSMEKWVFVFNTRFGLAPDVPLLLSEKQAEYPQIEIVSLSNDDLWTTMLSIDLYTAVKSATNSPRKSTLPCHKGLLFVVSMIFAPFRLSSGNIHDRVTDSQFCDLGNNKSHQNGSYCYREFVKLLKSCYLER